MEVPPAIDGTVLISDSDLAGIEFGDESLNPYAAFRSMQPVAVLQGGVDVYQGHFAVPLASALVAVRQAGNLAAAGHREQALTLAAQAVALAPESAITQLTLGDQFAAASRWSEAKQHYAIADRLTRSIRPDLQEEEMLPRITAGLAAVAKQVAP